MCNIWLHATLAWTKGVCPLQKENTYEGFAQDLDEWFLYLLNVMGGGGNVKLALYKLPAEEEKKNVLPINEPPKNESKYKTGDRNFNLNSDGP